MTSNDNQQYLTVEMFNSKMDTFMTQIRLENEKLRSELKAEIQNVRSDLHSEIQDLHSMILVNSAKIDMLQHTFYWGFAIMTLIITFVAVFIPYFMRERKEKTQEQPQPSLSEDRVKELIAQALNTLQSGGKATM